MIYEHEEFHKALKENKIEGTCILQDNGGWMVCLKTANGLISTTYLPEVTFDKETI